MDVFDNTIFVDLEKRLQKSVSDWEKGVDNSNDLDEIKGLNSKLIKQLNNILNDEYSPKIFNNDRANYLNNLIAKGCELNQKAVNKHMKGTKGSKTITIDNDKIIKAVSNKGGKSDNDRTKNYHKNMTLLVKDLEEYFES